MEIFYYKLLHNYLVQYNTSCKAGGEGRWRGSQMAEVVLNNGRNNLLLDLGWTTSFVSQIVGFVLLNNEDDYQVDDEDHYHHHYPSAPLLFHLHCGVYCWMFFVLLLVQKVRFKCLTTFRNFSYNEVSSRQVFSSSLIFFSMRTSHFQPLYVGVMILFCFGAILGFKVSDGWGPAFSQPANQPAITWLTANNAGNKSNWKWKQ